MVAYCIFFLSLIQRQFCCSFMMHKMKKKSVLGVVNVFGKSNGFFEVMLLDG